MPTRIYESKGQMIMTTKHMLHFAVGYLVVVHTACGENDAPNSIRTTANFVYSTAVSTLDGNTTFVGTLETLPETELSLDNALEFPGGADVAAFNGSIFITEFASQVLSKYDIIESELTEVSRLNFSDRGGTNYMFFLSATRAFVVNRPRLELVEFNPATMTVTGTIGIGAIAREDIGQEIRDGFLRTSDNTLFLNVSYNTNRQVFDNTMTIAAIDLDTGDVNVIEDATCPASAGFGGFFDDDGTLYLPAESFGGFTLFADPTQIKTNCVLRIRPDSRIFDPEYRFQPAAQMSGGEMWGLYPSGGGIAVTTGVALPRISEFENPIQFLGAQIHGGWAIDVRNQTATRIDSLPEDGVGIGAFSAGQTLLIPRSSGTVVVDEIENSQTAIYEYNPATNQVDLIFTMPGITNSLIAL